MADRSKANRGRYQAHMIMEFLDLNSEYIYLPHPASRALVINGHTTGSSTKQTLARWRHADTITLKHLDSMLMRFGLMLHEFEFWAVQTHGWDGYLNGSGRYELEGQNEQGMLQHA